MSLDFAGATVVVRRSERVNLLSREKTRAGHKEAAISRLLTSLRGRGECGVPALPLDVLNEGRRVCRISPWRRKVRLNASRPNNSYSY